MKILGLGILLNAGRSLNVNSKVMAIMIVIMGIGLVIDSVIFLRLEHKVMSR